MHSRNWKWSIEMSEEHPINSNFWYNTGLFSVVSPMFHDRNCWKLSLRVLFSIESVEINSSRISVDNWLCWLNKKGLDDWKKITVKLKWNSTSNAVELSIVYFLCFYRYQLILITSHDVNVETIQFHIFPHFLFYAEADQHENVRQAVVWKRRGLTSVVEHTSSLFNRLLECFVTIV